MELHDRAKYQNKVIELKTENNSLLKEILTIINRGDLFPDEVAAEAEMMAAIANTIGSRWQNDIRLQKYLAAEKRGGELDGMALDYLAKYRKAMEHIEREKKPLRLLNKIQENERNVEICEEVVNNWAELPEKSNDGNPLPILSTLDANEHILFNLFPMFKTHSLFLKEKGYYSSSKGCLIWTPTHGGNLLLAAYFGMIQDNPGSGRNIWAPVEKAFNTKYLAQHYSDYETMRKGKTIKYDKYDKELRDLVAGKISL